MTTTTATRYALKTETGQFVTANTAGRYFLTMNANLAISFGSPNSAYPLVDLISDKIGERVNVAKISIIR